MLQILLLALHLLPIPDVDLRAWRIDLAIRSAAAAEGIDPHVLRALLIVESRLDPDARSRFGVGIAQFTPAGVRGVNRLREQAGRPGGFGMVKAMDPAEAIPAAAELLSGFRRLCGGAVEAMLSGYNAGYAQCRAVRRLGAVEARRRGYRGGRYARKVLRLAESLRRASPARL